MVQGRPSEAAIPAQEAAAFPVDAQVTTLAPRSNAFTMPTAEARSFSEAVGLRPSSLTHSRDIPKANRNRSTGYKGEFPTCSEGCLLYTSDAADDLLCVDLGGRRIIKK